MTMTRRRATTIEGAGSIAGADDFKPFPRGEDRLGEPVREWFGKSAHAVGIFAASARRIAA